MLSPPELANGDRFGQDVALQGGTALVAAPGHDQPAFNAGAVFVLDLVGGQWVQTAKLVSSDLVDNSFGWSVALEGEHAVVGAHFDSTLGDHLGAAYLFQRDRTGWSQLAKFGGSAPVDGDYTLGPPGIPLAPTTGTLDPWGRA